jgi:hypothetical protein
MARHIRGPAPTQRSSRANMNRLTRGGVEDNLLRKHRRHLDRPLSTSIILEGSEVDNRIDEPLVLLAKGLISCASSLASTRQFVVPDDTAFRIRLDETLTSTDSSCAAQFGLTRRTIPSSRGRAAANNPSFWIKSVHFAHTGTKQEGF